VPAASTTDEWFDPAASPTQDEACDGVDTDGDGALLSQDPYSEGGGTIAALGLPFNGSVIEPTETVYVDVLRWGGQVSSGHTHTTRVFESVSGAAGPYAEIASLGQGTMGTPGVSAWFTHSGVDLLGHPLQHGVRAARRAGRRR
jgi:hypothetical protein